MLNTRAPGEPYLVERGVDQYEYQLPVSVKAVVSWNGRLPLVRNERDEWELPGGKLRLGESPADCLARELRAELSWDAVLGGPHHAWVYQVFPDRHVFVLAHLASYSGSAAPVHGGGHELVVVTPAEVDALNMPEDYKVAVRKAAEQGHFG